MTPDQRKHWEKRFDYLVVKGCLGGTTDIEEMKRSRIQALLREPLSPVERSAWAKREWEHRQLMKQVDRYYLHPATPKKP